MSASNKNSDHNNNVWQYGFTLLELLIALAVFSISSASLVLSDGQAIRQVNQVNNKVLASWLAETELNRLYIEQSWPDTGISGYAQSMAKREWYVQKEVLSAEEKFRQVNIRVYTGNQPQARNEVYRLTGYIRRSGR